jgi:hypothetical protein
MAGRVAATLLGSLLAAAAASATPVIDVVVESNDGSSATVGIDLTTSAEGLIAYSFSVAFGGTLSFVGGDRVTPPGMVGLGSFDNGGAGPGIITLIAAGSATVVDPLGVGGVTWRVANLTFALNGGGGLVETGAFFDGVDGFVLDPGDYTSEGDFGGANVDLVTFGAASLAIPEPSTLALLALGLAALARAGRPRSVAKPFPGRSA